MNFGAGRPDFWDGGEERRHLAQRETHIIGRGPSVRSRSDPALLEVIDARLRPRDQRDKDQAEQRDVEVRQSDHARARPAPRQFLFVTHLRFERRFGVELDTESRSRSS